MNARRDLYSLLPAVYHLRDFDEGEPLHALLDVIDEQVGVVSDSLRQLYENWFIETCEDWVVPYIGDLLGARRDDFAIDPSLRAEAAGRLQQFLFPRREIANAIRFRRRKGTLAVLEDLAEHVAGWPARAVEFGSLLVTTPTVRHPHLEPAPTLNVTDADLLDRMGGPFEGISHLPSVRVLNGLDLTSRFGPSKLGVYVWRHKSFGLRRVPAYCLRTIDEGGLSARVFQLNPLGIATQLYVKAVREAEPTSIAEEPNLPVPLRLPALTVFEPSPDAPSTLRPVASPVYYGRRRSLGLWTASSTADGSDVMQFIDAFEVLPMDLGWLVETRDEIGGPTLMRRRNRLLKLLRNHTYKAAVDPARGLVVSPHRSILASFQYGSLGDLGGGPYQRDFAPPAASSSLKRVSHIDINSGDEIGSLDSVLTEAAKVETAESVVEIVDDHVYRLTRFPHVRVGQTLQLRAANGRRPVILLNRDNCDGGLNVRINNHSRIVLDGLVIAGNGLGVVSGAPGEAQTAGKGCAAKNREAPRLEIRHCTLVPGAVLSKCSAASRPSVALDLPGGVVVIRSSIIGPVIQSSGITRDDDNRPATQIPLQLAIIDSIVEGARAGKDSGDADHAIHGFHDFDCRVQRSTVFGQVSASTLSAQDAIFLDTVCVRRCDTAGIRFSYLPTESETPARYYCQPELSEQRKSDSESCPDAPESAESRPVVPLFVAVHSRRPRYGDAAYAQLSDACPSEIREGAEDGGEMGAFNRLALPHREKNLRDRLEEFTPVLMESEILFAN